jgi:hypothetical protein
LDGYVYGGIVNATIDPALVVSASSTNFFGFQTNGMAINSAAPWKSKTALPVVMSSFSVY